MQHTRQIQVVKEYYGRVLQHKNDLKTTACCSADSLPSYLSDIVSKIHEDVRSRFYGCGVPVPACPEGLQVLDLGCGTGRDVFMLSPLVGEAGKVIGIDMTEEQLEVGRRHQDYHRKIFNLTSENVSFRQGYIEDLAAADIADGSIDLVISNCVINLSPDKERVFSEIFRVLKPGGELYFSDVYCDRRLSEEAKNDSLVLGECLGGALYFEDYRRLLAKTGCADVRMVSRTDIAINNPAILAKTGHAGFYSATTRAFALKLEDRCEDYGQTARYLGTAKNLPHGFRLDDHHYFETGRRMPVCSNTASMLRETRFGKYFEIAGNTARHYGLFDCNSPSGDLETGSSGCC